MTDGSGPVPGSPRPLRMVGVTASWGACFIAIEWGLRDAPVLWFASLRAILAGLALLTVAWLQRRPHPRVVRDWLRIGLLGLLFVSLVGTAAAFVVWFDESRRSRLDQLTAWTFLVPVVGIALSVVVLGERPTGWAVSGLAVVLFALWRSVGCAPPPPSTGPPAPSRGPRVKAWFRTSHRVPGNRTES